MVDYTRYRDLKVEIKDKVALLTLNRPEEMNAIPRDMHVQLEGAIDDLAEDEDVNAIVLTGAGRAFSAGGNLKQMQARFGDPSAPRTPWRSPLRLVDHILNCDKPIIAAVNGHAIGLGASLALFCDVIFMAENAKIADTHVNIGLVAGDGGSVMWPILIGPSRAKQYLMTGDTLNGTEAERIGLVNKALPQEQVLPAAMAFAQRLANGPLKAISWTKMSVNQYLKQAMTLVMPTSLATEFLCFQSSDHEEAVNSFLEKRPPKFTGR